MPADAYQATFAPNTKWTSPYAEGAEIKAYWEKVAAKYDVRKYIQFNTNVISANWSPEKSRWILEIERGGVRQTEETDFLIMATGHFSTPRLPNYPGIEDYTGHLRHSSNWDPNFDPTGKIVAVIGNGASGLQVVPQLQKVSKKLFHFARSRTWIAGTVAGDVLGQDNTVVRTKEVPQEPEEYLAYRKNIENRLFSRWAATFKESDKNKDAKANFEKLMADRLGDRKDLLDAIVPDFSPSCRRLTPGPGYLEAITKENVEYVPARISRFTATGIETVDGKHREFDAIICSTGADTSFAVPFPVVAFGTDLKPAWRPGGTPGFPDSYLGIAAPSFPNFLILLGPNATGVASALPHAIENQITYVAKILRKARREGIRTIAPTRKATDDFRAYCESFFPRTVMSENCSSWYNGGIAGGRIHGIWPGSGTHANLAKREVRWEDWEYTYKNMQGNRFAWLGNGWSVRDGESAAGNEDVEFTQYLKKEAVGGEVDLKAYHEDWWGA